MTAKRLLTGILAVLVIAAVMAPSLIAQSLVSGDLTGTITDPSGAVVTNAKVTITNAQTSVSASTVSSSAGTYSFKGLLPGQYTVSVDASGFKKEVKRDVTIEVSTTATIGIGLSAAPTAIGNVWPRISVRRASGAVTCDIGLSERAASSSPSWLRRTPMRWC